MPALRNNQVSVGNLDVESSFHKKENSKDDNVRRQSSAAKGLCKKCSCTLQIITGIIVTTLVATAITVPIVIFQNHNKNNGQSTSTGIAASILITTINASITTTNTISTTSTTSTTTSTMPSASNITNTSNTTTTISTTTSTTTGSTSTTTTTPSCTAVPVGNLTIKTGPANWTLAAFNYTAVSTNPTLVFGFTTVTTGYNYLDDVSVVDNNASSIQLLNNPSFENTTSNLTGWTTWCTLTCTSGYPGKVITNTSCHSGSCYIDHCKSADYDYLVQSFPATIGHIYTISFWFQQLGTGVMKLYATVQH